MIIADIIHLFVYLEILLIVLIIILIIPGYIGLKERGNYAYQRQPYNVRPVIHEMLEGQEKDDISVCSRFIALPDQAYQESPWFNNQPRWTLEKRPGSLQCSQPDPETVVITAWGEKGEKLSEETIRSRKTD